MGCRVVELESAAINRDWNRSLETLDSEADRRSSGRFESDEFEFGNWSSPISLAMTLGERCSSAVGICLGWRLPLASVVARLSSESRGASFRNFQDDLTPSFNSNTGSGSGDLGGSSGGGGGVCFPKSGDDFPESDVASPT